MPRPQGVDTPRTPGAWTDAERRRRDDLIRTRYTHASWNEKR